MNPRASRRAILVAACAGALLAACGGNVAEQASPLPPPQRTLAAQPQPQPQPQPLSQIHYEAAVQRLYLAYLGRPADPDGLAFYTRVGTQLALPGDTGTLYWRYGEPGVRQLLDSLAGSPEASALYAGEDAAAVVTAMYRNLFNREPDAGGLAFWSGALSSGRLTRAEVPVALLSGAHLTDLEVFERKAAVAGAFSDALDTPERAAHYHGEAAVAALRVVLGKVSAATSPAGQAALVDEAMAAVAASPAFPKVQAIVRARCVACHSATPTMRGFPSAPRGIRFDTAEQIRADAYRIYVNVVQTQFMPYGNQTSMTLAEREVVRAWYAGKAE